MYVTDVQFVYTLFQHRGEKTPKPLISGISDGDNYYLLKMFMPGTGISLYEAEENKQRLAKLFEQEIYVNSLKDHLWALGLPLLAEYNAWTFQSSLETSNGIEDAEAIITKNLIIMGSRRPQKWERVLSDASAVYQDIQNRGVYVGYEKKMPIYDFTITGRSKTSGFNIQGMTSDTDIRIIPYSEDIFVHLDWMGADIRACSIMSGDAEMEEAFLTSDPYTKLASELNDISREDIKLEMLESIYSLNHDSPVVEYYKDFQKWMVSTIDKMDQHGYTHSILGRQFSLDDQKARKTVFNACIQGTVAHAMQNVISRMYLIFPECVLTEVHDSVVLQCHPQVVSNIVDKAVQIMLRPFEGLLKSNPVFPVKVSIGKRWRQWKKYREFRK